MVLIPVRCPICKSCQITKHGKTQERKQRFLCKNSTCVCCTFILDYSYNGCVAKNKKNIIDMAVNGSGTRDIARVLKISPTTVTETFKRLEPRLIQVNHSVLSQTNANMEAQIEKVIECEADEQWSFVGSKQNQRWLWHAIDHQTGKLLAYVFGKRKDDVFLQLKKLLQPFGISRFYTDNLATYKRHIQPEIHETGKRNIQKIERKHLTLRTRIKRLARKTLCFSKSEFLHDLVIGLFINRHEFGLEI